MKIVSLLPSAMESLFALGLGDQLVAVTHECDYPPEAASLPVVTRPNLHLHELESGVIEMAVSSAATAGQSLYAVDTVAIRALEPDLVVTQDVCRVCAVSADQVALDLEGIPQARRLPRAAGREPLSNLAVHWSGTDAQLRCRAWRGRRSRTPGLM